MRVASLVNLAMELSRLMARVLLGASGCFFVFLFVSMCVCVFLCGGIATNFQT